MKIDWVGVGIAERVERDRERRRRVQIVQVVGRTETVRHWHRREHPPGTDTARVGRAQAFVLDAQVEHGADAEQGGVGTAVVRKPQRRSAENGATRDRSARRQPRAGQVARVVQLGGQDGRVRRARQGLAERTCPAGVGVGGAFRGKHARLGRVVLDGRLRLPVALRNRPRAASCRAEQCQRPIG